MNIEKIKITAPSTALKNGLSYFDEIEVPMLFPVGNKQKISKPLGTGDCKLFQFGSDFALDWHTSFVPCYYIYIQGAQEIEVSGGEIRQFKAGDILLDRRHLGQRPQKPFHSRCAWPRTDYPYIVESKKRYKVTKKRKKHENKIQVTYLGLFIKRYLCSLCISHGRLP